MESARRALACAVLAMSCSWALGQARGGEASGAQEPAQKQERESPWMLVPIFTSNPKLGTSLGALAGGSD